MKKLIIAVVLLLGVIYVIASLSELQDMAETLRHGDWRFLLLALAIEAVWMLNVASAYRTVYRAVGLDERIEKLFLLSQASFFINIIAPSGGMGGMAVFVAEARRRGYSAARTSVACMLFYLFDYAGFLIVLIVGLGVLFRRDNLGWGEITATAVLFALAAGLGMLIFMGLRSTQSQGRALAWLARSVNRILRPFLKRDYLLEARAYSFAEEAANGLRQVRARPENLMIPTALTLSSKALLISILFLMFLAFQVPFSPGTLIAGFSIGYLFLIISPTPAGLGVVEGALTLSLSSQGIPLSAAAVVTLAYRAVTFWFPMGVGIIAFRWLSRAENRQMA